MEKVNKIQAAWNVNHTLFYVKIMFLRMSKRKSQKIKNNFEIM